MILYIYKYINILRKCLEYLHISEFMQICIEMTVQRPARERACILDHSRLWPKFVGASAELEISLNLRVVPEPRELTGKSHLTMLRSLSCLDIIIE